MIYSEQQLIDEWKMRSGLEPVRIDATLQRYDALDIDAYVKKMLDDWYLRLLDEGDISLLDPEDVTEEVTVEGLADGVAYITLPEGTRRLLEVSDSAWHRPAMITRADTVLGRRQESVFGRGRAASPVAVVDSPLHVRLYSYLPGSSPSLDRVLVVRHTPGVYLLSPRALSLIPGINEYHLL